MQKARGHRTSLLPPLVGTRFQVLFHSPSGVLFTFPSRYLSAIGHLGVLSLGGWSPQVQSAFHGCGPTQERLTAGQSVSSTGRLPSMVRGSTRFVYHTTWSLLPGKPLPGPDALQPPDRNAWPLTRPGFGLIPFRSPLLRESRLISFPRGTEMFHFPRLPSPRLCVQRGMTPHYRRRVSPFGNPRVKGCSAPHRGLSQPFTPFIDSWCQGIHHMPLLS